MASIIDKVAQCLVTAGSTFREDQKDAVDELVKFIESDRQ